MSADPLLTLEDLDLFLLAHKALRGDLARFAAAIPRLTYADGGTRRAIEMFEWFRRVQTLVQVHHESEDDGLYPLLVDKDPAWVEHERRLGADHERLDPLMVQVVDGFRVLTRADADAFDAARDALAETIVTLADVMADHLEREEAATIPALTSTVTRKELDALERKNAKKIPMSAMMLILPWMIDAADENERAKIDAILPWPVKLLYRLSWRRKFERLSSAVVVAA